MIFVVILTLLAQPQTEAQWVEVIRQERGLLVEDIEVRQWDDTRVDILTDTHAIEVDFGRKWAEAIGQALYYAELTGRKPGIILLLRPDTDRYAYRCQTVCAKYQIRLWVRDIP